MCEEAKTNINVLQNLEWRQKRQEREYNQIKQEQLKSNTHVLEATEIPEAGEVIIVALASCMPWKQGTVLGSLTCKIAHFFTGSEKQTTTIKSLPFYVKIKLNW